MGSRLQVLRKGALESKVGMESVVRTQGAEWRVGGLHPPARAQSGVRGGYRYRTCSTAARCF